MPSAPHTLGSATFDPDAFFRSWDAAQWTPQLTDFRGMIARAFGIPGDDDYTYHAIAAVTLAQVQHALEAGSSNGLLDWYRDESGDVIPPPPPADIAAYTALFSPTTSLPKALASLAANARKASLRAAIAAHLQAHTTLPSPSSSSPSQLVLPAKQKPSPALTNPSLDVWTWSCHALRWAGPAPSTAALTTSHHVLPVIYHHFGCVVPTLAAVRLIAQLAGVRDAGKQSGRAVLDIGSGNGYWAYVLRRSGVRVHAVDNGHSAWRTMWIGDTHDADGVAFLRGGAPAGAPAGVQADIGRGGRDAVLLLVYPQVSGDFTGKVLRAYEGDTVVVAGTQNRNGYTGFKDRLVDEWMAQVKPELVRTVQIPLPSFAGKDEALFVFQRRR